MRHQLRILWYLLQALLFAYLFYKKSLGLNLVLYEGVIFSFWMYSKQVNFKNNFQKILIFGLLYTNIMWMFHFSSIVLYVNLITWNILMGTLILKDSKSIIYSLISGISNWVNALFNLQKETLEVEKNQKKKRLKGIYIIPSLIVLIFVYLYSAGNPIFGDLIGSLFDRVIDVFETLDLIFIFYLLIGMLFYSIWKKLKGSSEIKKLANQSEKLNRVRKQNWAFSTSIIALKDEMKSAIFLITFLNVLLLLVNVIDVNWVWFNFQWEGEYLKEFVHKGTYMLIISIFVSVGIILYFFRGNLNFLKNRKLRILTNLWLFQNLILAISLCIRNGYYIKIFSLAHGRIGIFFFLGFIIGGLIVVYWKVNYQKTIHFVLNRQSLISWCLLLVLSSINVSPRASTSFLVLNWM